MIKIFFIIIGAISLIYIYKNTVSTIENYTDNKLALLLSEYNDSFNNVMDEKYFDNFKKEFKQNLMVHDGKVTKASHFETVGQHFALINAIKILNKVNDSAYKLKNLYSVCYKHKDGPCNNDCKSIAPQLCFT